MKTFYDKFDLIPHLMVQTHRDDIEEAIGQIWEYLLEKDLSFAVTDFDDDIVGVSLNTDGQDPPNLTLNTDFLHYIFGFLISIETPVLLVCFSLP